MENADKNERPMTTGVFFDTVCGILKEKGFMPEGMLDYALASREEVPLRTYEFSVCNNLCYGDSEGIYLDLSVKVYEDEGTVQRRELGTFKTLENDREAMRTMGRLLADFIVEARNYVDTHFDDFQWTGFNVYGMNDDGTNTGWGYSCENMEGAVKRKEELLNKFPHVLVRDNATREEKTYSRQPSGVR